MADLGRILAEAKAKAVRAAQSAQQQTAAAAGASHRAAAGTNGTAAAAATNGGAAAAAVAAATARVQALAGGGLGMGTNGGSAGPAATAATAAARAKAAEVRHEELLAGAGGPGGEGGGRFDAMEGLLSFAQTVKVFHITSQIKGHNERRDGWMSTAFVRLSECRWRMVLIRFKWTRKRPVSYFELLCASGRGERRLVSSSRVLAVERLRGGKRSCHTSFTHLICPVHNFPVFSHPLRCFVEGA